LPDPKELTGVRLAAERAISSYQRGNYSECLAIADSILAGRASTPVAKTLRAHCLLRLGRGSEAVEAYAQALRDHAGGPQEFGLLKEQARAYLLAGQLDRALALTRPLLDQRPTEPELHIQLGEILEAKGDHAGALRAYEREAELSPTETRPLLRAGQLYAAQKRTRDAERTYRRALERRPNDPDVLVTLSQLLDDTGRSAEAEALLEHALAVAPDSPTAHYRMAWKLRNQGKRREAVAHYQAAARSMPNSGLLRFELGKLYSEMGEIDSAKAAYRAAISLTPTQARAYANLAALEARAGNLAEALELWREALEIGLAAGEADLVRRNMQQAEAMLRDQRAGQ
jgi:tetratricopeptide (TPR) repeat protein